MRISDWSSDVCSSDLSDKGWMESGYDGLMAAEKKFGAKIKVKYIENVKFGDMEQVLVALAGKNDLVIGVGGQTQASVFKVAPRFPKVKFAIIGGNADAADRKSTRLNSSH